MTGMTLEIQGVEAVTKAAQDVENKIADGLLVGRAALIIERQAKQNASGRPGPRTQTGRLRTSITTDILSKEAARVGTNVFYASYVEFGHRQHPGQFVPPLGKRLVAAFAPAYPFLNPAIEQLKDKIGDVVVIFGGEIGQEWGK